MAGYYRQLRRLVYRQLFLLATEERELLFDEEGDPRLVQLYARHYGIGRLRPLAGGLFGAGSCDDLDVALIDNGRLLAALRDLSLVKDAKTGLARWVNYRDMK